MIFRVRVPVNAEVHACGPVVSVEPGHPAYSAVCPVCDLAIGSDPMAIVYVGVLPERRESDGFMRGAGIPVHAAHTRIPDEEDTHEILEESIGARGGDAPAAVDSSVR